MKQFIGCDLGGTNLRAGLVNPQTGEVTHTVSIPTLSRQGHEAVMARMAELFMQVIIKAGLSKEDIGAIGIGVPGVLDIDRGVVLFLPNLPGNWPKVPLAETIERLTGLPVFLINDVRSILYGEWRFGAGRDFSTVVCFAIGTGIGGGLVINDRLHLGFGGTAGELGHMIIDFNGPKCGCGNYGCLEVYASGPAIASMGIKAVVQGLTTSIADLVDGDLNRITPAVIAQAAEQGDEIARDIFEHAGYYLGIAAANMMVSISPQRIILSGGVAKAGNLLIEPLWRTLQERVKVVPLEHTRVVTAALGDQAGVVGAALWAEQRLMDRAGPGSQGQT
jgi:glucokinase